MSINRVNTTVEERNFKFLTNQSSILHTVDTNKITVNGVNVIVDKPKRGDVMCITHYKEGGTLLDANKQKVVWIDGLSVNPTQLSQEYEPVGICLVVKGNKAIVRYREERSLRWSNAKRLKLPIIPQMNDGHSHNFTISLCTASVCISNPNPLVLTSADTASYSGFVAALNKWFKTNLGQPKDKAIIQPNPNNNIAYCSAELLSKPEDPLRYEIIVNVNPGFDIRNKKEFQFDEIQIANAQGDSILSSSETVEHASNIGYSYDYFIGHNFRKDYDGGCCRAKYFHFIRMVQEAPAKEMTSIDSFIGRESGESNTLPVREADFTDNPYCKLLRDTFASYDEYLNSMMVKYPCGAGGAITEFPCGKENTYKLADYTFLDNTTVTGEQSPLYPAANWAASISLNAPKLGKGNWWLPSAAEIVEIMRDITYGSKEWAANPDIINLVLQKLTSIDNSGWSMLSAQDSRWTSSRCLDFTAYWYDGFGGILYGYNENNYEEDFLALYKKKMVSPITIYEF